MQKWWLIGAGVLGIALAILLIPSPDTGETIPDTTTAPSTDEGEAVAKTKVGRTKKRGAGVRSVEGPNPVARMVAERRAVPEGRYAAKASAPWTEIRRKLALKAVVGEADPALTELVEAADAMAEQMTELRKNPQAYEWDAVETSQKELIAKIRASGYHDAEIEELMALLEERVGEYYEDKAKTEAEAAAGGTAEEGAATEGAATEDATTEEPPGTAEGDPGTP